MESITRSEVKEPEYTVLSLIVESNAVSKILAPISKKGLHVCRIPFESLTEAKAFMEEKIDQSKVEG